MYDLGVVKTNKEKPLSSDQIENNIIELKRKLLSWKDPMASQVISGESEIVRKLPGNLKKGFMVKNYIFGYALLLTLFNDIQFALETCS